LLFTKALELFAEYMKMIQRSKSTIRSYTDQLESFNNYLCRTYNQPVYLEDVKAEDMNKYLFNELSEGKYSSSYRHNMITAFRSLYNFCKSKGHCEVNVGKQVKFIKVYTKERQY
jgi:site-specific recombinase XerD